MKKIKVTRTVHRKVPWYEKPKILFLAIAGALMVAGVLMAQITGMLREKSYQGQEGSADSTLVTPQSIEAEEIDVYALLPVPGDLLPAGRPGAA